MGLTRAFLYAGAVSTVSSLWEVEDQSTSLLMEEFYQRVRKGEGKAEALRQAKLELIQSKIELKALGMRESLAAPFYWQHLCILVIGSRCTANYSCCFSWTLESN